MKDKKDKHERSTEVMLPRPLLPILAFMVGYQVRSVPSEASIADDSVLTGHVRPSGL